MNSENKKTILLVEDEAVIAITEKKLLEKKGYTVHTVSTGEKAVETIIDDILPVDLILMDIDLGSGMDGTQAAAQILNHKDIPVVFLSSHTEPEVVEKTEKITSYGYVVKNSGIIVLDASIKMALKLFEAKVYHNQAEKEIQLKNEEFEATNEELTAAIEEMEAANEELISANQSIQQADESLRKSEAIKNKMVSNIGDVIVIIDENGINRYKSPNITKLFGWAPEELVGKNTWDNIHPDDLEAGQSFFYKILKEPDAVGTTELRYKRKDGNYVWIEISVINLLLDRDIQGILGNYHDITDRKQAEDALRKSQTRYQTAQAIGHVGNWEYDLNTGQFWGSDEAKRIYGFDPNIDSFSTEAVESCIPERNRVHQALIDLIEKDAEYNLEFQIIPVNSKQPKTIASIAELRKDDKGLPMMVCGVIQDITERKQAKDALEKTIYELRKSQEVAKVGNWVWNISQNRVEWSDEMYRIFGIDKKHFTGDLTRVISNCIHPDDQAEVIRSNKSVMEQKTPIPVEYRIIRPDGNVRTVWAEAGELELDKTGKPILLRGIIHDITERKEAEKKIKKQLAEKEILLLEVHHRVKNNIANIEGLLSIQADSTGIPEVKTGLEDALFRIKSMRILYEKLLLSGDYDDISIKSYMESLIDLFIIAFNFEKKIIIDKQITDFTITAKKAVSAGIIINELLTNVFKYAFKGREGGTVSVLIKKDGNTATLIIHDNGIGIDDRIKAEISTGFGLTIVKMLAEQLNGTYSIVNENGTKSVVQFEI